MSNSRESPASSNTTNNKPQDRDPKPASSSSITDKLAAHKEADGNIMAKKFQHYIEPAIQPPPTPLKYTSRPFFFYGSLTDPLLLQQILHLPPPPTLKPATLLHYKIMLWGQYPALVPGPYNNCISGMTYFIETEEQQKKLEDYETSVYRVRNTRVRIEGEDVLGRTFVWGRGVEELEEGEWDLESWKRGVEEEMKSHFLPVEE